MYLVKCTSQEKSDKSLPISQIGSIEVEIFPHERLNAYKGVITSENLFKNSDEEVLEWLTMRGFPATSIIYRFPWRQTPNDILSCDSYSYLPATQATKGSRHCLWVFLSPTLYQILNDASVTDVTVIWILPSKVGMRCVHIASWLNMSTHKKILAQLLQKVWIARETTWLFLEDAQIGKLRRKYKK